MKLKEAEIISLKNLIDNLTSMNLLVFTQYLSNLNTINELYNLKKKSNEFDQNNSKDN